MNDNNHAGAMVATNGLTEQSIATTGATAQEVLAMREKATIEARLIVAMKNQRDWNVIRRNILDAVERPGFADADLGPDKKGSGMFKLKFGKTTIEGFSIRFAEEAMRCMGHIDASSSIIWEDEEKRIINVVVFDLVSNISIPTQIIVSKNTERKELKEGQIALSMRRNSNGDPVYLVRATDADVTKQQNAEVSKAIRNGVMRILPGDIQSECRARMLEIRRGSRKPDNPEQHQREMVDAFAKFGATPDELTQFIGHPLKSVTEEEVTFMKDLYRRITNKETTWVNEFKAVMKDREPKKEDAPEEPQNSWSNPSSEPQPSPSVQLANQLTEMKEKIIQNAASLWGSDAAMHKLDGFLKQASPPINFITITRDEAAWALTELSDRVAAQKQQ